MYQFPKKKDNKTTFVELSRRDVQDATRLLSLLSDSTTQDELSRNIPALANKDEMIRVATSIFYARKRRTRFFNPDMFGEAAWEFLLVLYIADERGPRFTVGRLREFAGVPSSSTARWLAYLESQQLIFRESHPTDARASFVRLTDKGRELIEMYLSETLIEGR